MQEFLEGSKDAVREFSLISGRQFEKGYDLSGAVTSNDKDGTDNDGDDKSIEEDEDAVNSWDSIADSSDTSTEGRLRRMVSKKVFDHLNLASTIIRDKGERFVLKDVSIESVLLNSCRTQGIHRSDQFESFEEENERRSTMGFPDALLDSALNNENNMEVKLGER